MNRMLDTSLALMLESGTSVLVTLANESGAVLDQVDVFGAAAQNLSLWGHSIWGQFNWGALPSFFQQYRVPWDIPLIFKQAFLSVTGASGPNIALGNLYMGYQPLGYMLQDLPVFTGYTGLEATTDGMGGFTALMATNDGAGNYTALEVGPTYG